MTLITQAPAAEAPRVRPPSPIVLPPTRRRRPTRRRSILALLLASLLFQALLVSLLLHLGLLAWLLAEPAAPLPAAMSPLEITLVPEPESPTGVEKPLVPSPDAREQPPVAPPSPSDAEPATPAPPAPQAPPAPPSDEPPAPPPPAETAIETPPSPPPAIELAPAVRLETLPPEPANPLLKPALPPLAKVVPPTAPAPRPAKPQTAPQRKPVISPPMRFSWSDDPLHSGTSRPPPAAIPRGQIDLSLPPGLRNSPGAPPRAMGNTDSTMRMVGAQVGPEWGQLLHEWWNRHGYYPDAAAAFGQSGRVQLHMRVDRDGSVHDLQLLDGSGSPYLDMGALSVFRGAHLPKFPQNTPESQGDLYLDIQYVLLHP